MNLLFIILLYNAAVAMMFIKPVLFVFGADVCHYSLVLMLSVILFCRVSTYNNAMAFFVLIPLFFVLLAAGMVSSETPAAFADGDIHRMFLKFALCFFLYLAPYFIFWMAYDLHKMSSPTQRT